MLTKDTQAMAMPPKLTCPGVFKGMTKNRNYYASVLVDYLDLIAGGHLL